MRARPYFWSVSFVRRFVRMAIWRLRRRRAFSALRGLDRTILKDTGLYRADLWRIAEAYADREDQRDECARPTQCRPRDRRSRD